MDDRVGRRLLAIVWMGAGLGVARSILWVRAPRIVTAALCIALGWAVLPVLPAARAAVGDGGLALLAAGGVAYTVGAGIYAARRPNPWPRVFGYHEVFHALVVVAAACHYLVVATAVAALR
jgi:hemolysin III